MIVVDTNVVAYLYIAGDKSAHAASLLKKDAFWCVPRLWRSEMRSVLSLYLRKDILNLADTCTIMLRAEHLLQKREFEVGSTDVMNLVKQSECSVYECEFVALAGHLDVPLITSDKKIIKAFPDTAFPLGNSG